MYMNKYLNKKVLITGHTGFKGSWLCKVLSLFGADIVGYSLEAEKESLYNIINAGAKVKSIIGDIRDIDKLQEVFTEEQPEIVFHLAAQPIVLKSYEQPVYTYDVNMMGTVNVCECIRKTTSVKSFVNVTTDKVYANKEWYWGYRECDELNGYDPYSNSKSCSELITNTYTQCYFKQKNLAVSTVRAGNVIGGGDYTDYRIIPDCVKAIIENKTIIIRNPFSVRPYQHVLEPLAAYLLIAIEQLEDINVAESYNIGPNESDCIQTGILVDKFKNEWNKEIKVECLEANKPHESTYLKLDTSKIKSKIKWEPKWNIDIAIKKTAEWYRRQLYDKDIEEFTINQIKEYFNMYK